MGARGSSPPLLALAVCLLAGGLAGQGTRADYQRAAGLRQQSAGKVLRAELRLAWAGDGSLAYAVESAQGQIDLVLVDPAAPAGERRRLLASGPELAAALGLEPGQARVARFAFDAASRVLLLLEGDAGACLWDRAAGRATPLDPADVPEFRLPPAWPRRRGSGASTGILFVNRSGQEAELFWREGPQQRRSYGRLAAGERRWQHTFAGHAWTVTGAGGAELGRFVGAEQPGVAVIEDAAAAAAPAEAAETAAPPEIAERPAPRDPRPFEPFARDHDLWLRSRDGGEERRLTTDGSAGDAYGPPFAWSPDGRHLVCFQTEPAQDHPVYLIESAPDDRLQPEHHSFDYLKPGDRIAHPRLRLFAVDQDGGARAIPVDDALFPTPWSLTRLEWAPDGARFTFLYNQRGHQLLRWLAVEAATGAVSTIIEEASPTFVDYAGKTFLHPLHAAGEAIWMSERSGWNHLYLVDSATGAVKRPITAGEWLVRGVERVDEERREVLIRLAGHNPGQDPYHVHYAVAGLDDGSLRLLTEGDGSHELELSPDGAFYTDTWSRVDLPPVVELRRYADGVHMTGLERADAAPLLETGWRLPQRFAAAGRDGATEIWGVVYRPTNHDPAKSYPLIEAIYAGPHGAHVPKGWAAHRKPQELAELGFIVVQIDGIGTNWRSKAFHDVAWKNLGDAGFPDRIAWIRALAATDPSIDLGRVGIYGGSAGGQNAMRALIAHGDFYRAAVADCGCHDNRMDKIWWNELWMGWPVGPHYEESSNVVQAHRMQGDLLLVVGELDRNVDPASTLQVVDALIAADKDFELLVMPGEGHGCAETPYGTRRRRDFFVRKLLGVEPRAE